jgi:hypothetical protein
MPLAPEPGEIIAYSGCQLPTQWKHPLCRNSDEHFSYLVLSSRVLLGPTAVIWNQDKEKA